MITRTSEHVMNRLQSLPSNTEITKEGWLVLVIKMCKPEMDLEKNVPTILFLKQKSVDSGFELSDM